MAPPLLHPNCGVQLGDVFFHKWADRFQLWLWQQDDDTGDNIWRSVEIGHEREDGHRLTITAQSQRPSWVGGDWSVKHISAGAQH